MRDRYAEIVYRYYYATAAALELALGDPHPGNYLLCEDGKVAFFDFGMISRLPRSYLREEGEVFRAVRAGDAAALAAKLRELGYLTGEANDWNAELLLEHMRSLSWWLLADEPLRLAPEDLWRGTETMREEHGREMIDQVPPDVASAQALLLRRMEGLLFQIASTLRAQADLGRPDAGARRGGQTDNRARRRARAMARRACRLAPLSRWRRSARAGRPGRRRAARSPAAAAG